MLHTYKIGYLKIQLLGSLHLKHSWEITLDVSHLRVFCSKAWVGIPLDKRKSFQPQSSECILLGYADDTEGYNLMEIATRRFFIKRSVKLNEYPLQDL